MYRGIVLTCNFIGFKLIKYATIKTRVRTEKKLTREFIEREKKLIKFYEARLKHKNDTIHELHRKYEWRQQIAEIRHKKEKKELESAHLKELRKIQKAADVYKKLNVKYKSKREDFGTRIDQKSSDIHETMNLMTSQVKKILHKMEYLKIEMDRDKEKNDVKIKENIAKADNIMNNVFNIREKRTANG